MDTDIRTFVAGIPPVTRFIVFGKLVITMIGFYNIIGIGQFVLTWFHVYQRFHIWRLVTGGLVHFGLDFMFLFNLVFLYRFSRSLEEGAYQGRQADFVYLVALLWILLAAAAMLLEFVTFAPALDLAIIYLWSQLNKEQTVSFFFGIKVKAMYLPWAMLAFNVLTGASIVMPLLGIVCGHMMFFLQYIYPEHSGVHLVPKTPQFLHNWFPEQRGSNISSFGTAPARGGSRSGAPAGSGSHSWGRGNTLGGN